MKKSKRIKAWALAIVIAASIAGAHAYAVHSDSQSEPTRPAYHV